MSYRTIIVSISDATAATAVAEATKGLVAPDGEIVLVAAPASDSPGADRALPDPEVQGVPSATGPAVPAVRAPSDEHALARPFLERATQALDGGTFKVTSVVGSDDIVADLDATAREHDADLIVVPGSDSSRLQRLLGSTPAEELISSAPCPVLVVR